MKAYPKYKSSGTDWLGEIPSHWECAKLKYLGEARNGLTYSPDDICNESDGILVLRSSNIQNDLLSFENNVYVSKKVDELMMQAGDILICSRNGSAALIGKCTIIPKGIVATFGAFMMRFRSNINKKFTLYLIRTTLTHYRDLYSTSTINQLTNSMMGNMSVPLPSLEEQTVIASYLDYITGQIDALVAEKQAQVEDLRKYRISLITETVTHGLNPDASLRPSGIDWIGNIPEHWKTSKLKYFIDINSGEAIPRDEILSEGLYPIYGGGERIGFANNFNVDINSIIIGRVGARCGCVRLINEPAWATDNALVCTTNQDSKFISFFLDAANLNRLNESNAQPLITATKIKNLGVALPPLHEQKEIAEFLDEKTGKIDELIAELEAQLKDLAEYKQAVITEAVTGKVDVRDWKP